MWYFQTRTEKCCGWKDPAGSLQEMNGELRFLGSSLAPFPKQSTDFNTFTGNFLEYIEKWAVSRWRFCKDFDWKKKKQSITPRCIDSNFNISHRFQMWTKNFKTFLVLTGIKVYLNSDPEVVKAFEKKKKMHLIL